MIHPQPAIRSIRRWRGGRRLRTIALVGFLTVLISTVFISTSGWLLPALAQDGLKAAIVIDGNELFQISDSGGLTAEQRAIGVNQQLQAAIESQEPPVVTVEGSEKLPVISLSDTHLLTVTSEDSLPGRTQQQQASLWARTLERYLERAQRERSVSYLRSATLRGFGVLLLALALHWGLGWFWRRRLTPELHSVTQIPESPPTGEPQPPSSLSLFLNLLLAGLRLAIWAGAVLYVSNLFPWTRQWSYRLLDVLIRSFISPLFSLGENRYSVTDLLILASLLFVLEIATKSLTNLLKTRVLRVTIANRGAREVIAAVLRYGLLFIGGMVLLQIWGIDLSSLALLASALGIGIGLGLQDIAKDVGSGLVILFERPIQVGDFVQVGAFEGTIEQIGARSTLIRTLDQVSIIVPNSRFLGDEVINWSHDNPVSRLHLPVGVAYGSDMEKVRTTLLDAAHEHSRVLSNPKPLVIFKGFGDSSLDLELLVWTAEPSRQVILKSELYFSIDAKFRQRQVEIPFPQRDVRIRTDRLSTDRLSTDRLSIDRASFPRSPDETG